MSRLREAVALAKTSLELSERTDGFLTLTTLSWYRPEQGSHVYT